MWSLRKPRASRVSLRRRLMLLTATLVVAVFATISLSRPVLALDATWVGQDLKYDNNSYAEVTAPPDRSGEPHEYQWVDSSVTPQKVTVIYFANGNQYRDASATLVTYDLNGTSYTNASQPQTITVTRDLTAQNTGENQTLGTTCDGSVTGGIGWVLCPISNWLADGVDAVYGIVAQFLEVVPVTDTKSGIYQLWDVVRTIANVCFVIAFIIIIYSQLTSVGYSNYNLKDMIPRLMVAAVLVNISFWIAALAVDISNLLGHSIQAILVNIRENYTTGIDGISWKQVTAYILSGGTIALLGFAAATGGSWGALGFLIVASLASAAVAILVAFIILAARQALITALIIISPLAFVAYVLPNTQSLFDKWRKAFTTLLVFFPVFALLFGGAQLAGAAIINNADGHMHIVLIGMATQVVPLILTPMLIRFSTGILGQVANMANDKGRGLVDRARNWATDNADLLKARKIASSDRMPGRNPLSWVSPSQLGRRMDYRKRQRDAYKKDHEDYAAHRAERNRLGEINDAAAPPASGPDRRSGRERRAYAHRQQMIRSHGLHSEADIHKGRIDSDGEEHWNNYLQSAAGRSLREHRRNTHLAKGRADIADKDMTAADDLLLKQQINTTPHLRQAAIRTAVNTSEASAHQESIEGDAGLTWKLRQHNDPGLRAMRDTTDRSKGIADLYEKSMAAASDRALKSEIRTDAALNSIAVTTGINTKEATLHQAAVDATVNETWALRQKNSPGLRQIRTETHHAEGRAKIMDERMSAADQRAFETLVTNDAGYIQIRRDKEDTVTDTKHAQFQASEVEAAGERAFQHAFEDGVAGSRELRKQNVAIERMKKESATIANTLQKRADADWEHTSRTDSGVKSLRLKEVQATDAQRKTELEWNTLVENARALGDAAPDIDAANAATANSLKQLTQDIAVQENAMAEAKQVQTQNLAQAYKDSEKTQNRTLLKRAAGIGGREGEIQAYSKAWKQLVGEITENVETARSITSDYSRAQLKDILFKGKDPSGAPVTEALRQAAMYELLEKKGNNQDAQEIRDAIAKKGLMQDEKTGEYYEALRDPTTGRLVLTDDGRAQIDRSSPVTDNDEVSARRDWQQFYDDAANKSPHKLVTYSGTNKSDARSGLLVDESRTGIIRDALGGKFSPEKILNADVDELKSLYFDMEDPNGYYRSLTPDQQQKVNETLESSILQLQGNRNINTRIDDRNRGMMNEILAHIDPRYAETKLDAAGNPVLDTNGNPIHTYPVGEDKAIIPPNKRATAKKKCEFEPPVTVKPHDPAKPDKDYYTNRTIKDI